MANEHSSDETREKADELLRSALPSNRSLRQALSSLHEIYLTLKESGFTEKQSMWVIGYIMSCGASLSDD